MTEVTIVIRARNEEAHVRQLLPRLEECRPAVPFSLLLVDNGSTDATPDLMRQAGAEIVRLAPEEFGWGKSLNLGIAHAKTPLIVNLNADAIPRDSQWLERLVARMEDPQMAGVCSRQVAVPGLNPFEELGLSLAFLPDRQARMRVCLKVTEFRTDPFLFSSASNIIRRSVWEKIPFNEEIPHGEDRLWARDVLDAGYKVAYEPASVVQHSHRFRLRGAMARARDAGYGAKWVHGPAYRFDSMKFTLRAIYEAIKADVFYFARHGYWRFLPLVPVYEIWYHAALLAGARGYLTEHPLPDSEKTEDTK